MSSFPEHLHLFLVPIFQLRAADLGTSSGCPPAIQKGPCSMNHTSCISHKVIFEPFVAHLPRVAFLLVKRNEPSQLWVVVASIECIQLEGPQNPRQECPNAKHPGWAGVGGVTVTIHAASWVRRKTAAEAGMKLLRGGTPHKHNQRRWIWTK